MLSFFYRNHRGILSVVVICLIFSMFFFAVAGRGDLPTPKRNNEIVYKVGKDIHQKKVSKRQIDAMKVYLSYDFGTDLNDSLEKQNIFSDGFFIDLLDSSFGRGLAEKYFDLVKDDFSQRVQVHKNFRFYRHPSGKLDLEKELKRYAKDLYSHYKKVAAKDKAIDVKLLHEYIALAREQKKFSPRNTQRLTSLFIRDRRIGNDPSVEKRNFALFYAKSNEDLFGGAFIELCAQAVIQGANIAKENGYYTSYEEAKGIIMRRSMNLILNKYVRAEDKEILSKIHKSYQNSLGIQERDLVNAARDIITFKKMCKDVDTSVLLDKLSIKKMYSKEVENILVNIIHDSSNLMVHNIDDALQLQCYLESIGNVKEFIIPSEVVYDEKDIIKIAPALFTKRYELKLATLSKSEAANALHLKNIWEFQVSDKGWSLLKEKFSFDEVNASDRFSFLQSLKKEMKEEVEEYSRAKLVDVDNTFIRNCIDKLNLKKVSFSYNELIPSESFYKGFNERELASLLEGKKEGEELSFYTQDNEHFYRIYLLKKCKNIEFASFNLAKKKGYLTYLVNQKVKKISKGKVLTDETKKWYKEKLLYKEAKESVAKKIIQAEKKGVPYTEHMEKRLKAYKEKEPIYPPLLKQFSIYRGKEVVSRKGEGKEMAQEEFFSMKKGDVSSIYYLENNQPYYICFLNKKINEVKLKKYEKLLKTEILKERKDRLFDQLVSHIETNELIEMSRFEKGA